MSAGVDALCIGAPPSRGALARLADHGVRWSGAPRAGEPALVFATVPSAGRERTALRTARQLDLPLVLDLASPWALDGRTCYPTPLHLAADRRAMRSALAEATVVLVRTPAMAAACTGLGVARDRLLVVPDGCDAAARLAPNPGATFDIFVASRLLPAEHPPRATQNGLLERRPRQIEPIGATGFYLFSALAALRQKVPAVFARLRVQFAAPLDPSNLDIVTWLALESILAPSTGVPTVADAVFVCQHGEDGDASALDVPDALWPALATGRPLLAALPPGAGRDLVLGTGAGVKLPATDAPPLCLQIERMVAQKDAGQLPGGARPELLARLDSRIVASHLAAALRVVADGAPLPFATQDLWPVAPVTGITAA